MYTQNVNNIDKLDTIIKLSELINIYNLFIHQPIDINKIIYTIFNLKSI